jgi:CheY-like chemotaxis protein
MQTVEPFDHQDPSERRTVLVVDDDPDLLEVVRFALEGEGFGVETAENGEKALAHLRTGLRPALVLLDLMMPGMNGWTFLDELAKTPALKPVPVVVLSAAERMEVPAGAVAFARKPIDLGSLLDVIELHSREPDEVDG